MRAVILTNSTIEGIDVSSLTAPVESDKPVVYTNIDPKNFNDILRLYHYVVYPHYISNTPAVFVIENPDKIFRRLELIEDPMPVGCSLTGEKTLAHLERLPRVNLLKGVTFPTPKHIDVEPGQRLDPEQITAAKHYLGPLLCVAPAGAGKTSTLMGRIECLVKRGVRPGSILCLTFTRKAQKEMRNRLVSVIGRKKAQEVTIRTYHSLAYYLLTNFNGKKPELILNRMGILQKLIAENEYSVKTEEADTYIGLQLNSLLLPEGVNEKSLLYEKYLDYMKETQTTDQDYLLYQLYGLLRHKSTRDRLTNYLPPGANKLYPKGRWHFVLVDETQDNNLAQDVITRFLCPWDNLFFVGDPDQVLYTFRGSDVERILNMKKIYPNIREVALKTNYRSHPMIVTAATNVIKLNTRRKNNEILAAKKGNDVSVYTQTYEHIINEYKGIAATLKKLLDAGERPENVACLYRTNNQGDALSFYLGEADVPNFVHRTGVSLFNSFEMEALLNYLKIIVKEYRASPVFGRALLSCLRWRTKNISGYSKIVDCKTPLSVALEVATKNSDTRALDFLQQVGNLRLLLMPNANVYISFVRQKFIDITSDKLDLIEDIASRFSSPVDFIKWVERVRLSEKKNSKTENKVQLMTVHGAKGLEFPIVFLINCTEGYFPYARAVKEGFLEEERRIMYVGMSRAKNKLYMTGYSDNKRSISRFVKESGCLPNEAEYSDSGCQN